MKKLLSLLLVCSGLFRLSAAEPQNTTVRFAISAGRNFIGNVDVELFDAERPQTVRNFLVYLQTDSYQNVLLNRLIPNFVIQGGGFRVRETTSEQHVQEILQTPNYGKIANEAGLPPRLSNTYGTIAMAKLPDQPNSASSEWFFNLADNSANLDYQNAGFTVFGRVVSGMNILAQFNQSARNAGIVDLRQWFGEAAGAFSDIPVHYSGGVQPKYRDLYSVRITRLSGPNNDVVRPTVAIISPANNARVTTSATTVTGTASDNQALSQVVYFFGTSQAQTAVGTSSWSAQINLAPGPNTFSVQSVDTNGNVSVTATRTIYYVMQSTLHLNVEGSGTVSGPANGQVLEVGQSYRLIARPAPGYVFAGWSGGLTRPEADLTFTMQPDLALTARFVPNPFRPVRGSYQGLFLGLSRSLSGYITLTLQENGSFKGSLLSSSGTSGFSGQFSGEGRAQTQTAGANPLVLNLQLNLGNGRLTGTIASSSWQAPVYLLQSATDAGVAVAPWAGNYTMVAAGQRTEPTLPAGDGVANLSVDARGRLKLSGTLPDGAKWAQTANLSREGTWPVFSSINGGREVILGWASINAETRKVTGYLYWFKTGAATDPLYPAGFNTTVNLTGGPFATAPGQPVLNWSQGTLHLNGGTLTVPIEVPVSLDGRGRLVASPTADRVALKLTAAKGLVSGSFIHPVTKKVTPLRGIVRQDEGRMSGWFPGQNQTGWFSITATP